MYKYPLILLTCLVLSDACLMSMPDDETLASAYLERARYLYGFSEYDSVLHYYRSAEKIFIASGDHPSVAECRLGIVDLYRMRSEPSNATRMLESAEEYILTNMDMESESWAGALHTRAKLYLSTNRYDEAISLLRSQLSLHNQLGLDSTAAAGINSVLGAVYFTMDDLDSSEHYYQKAYRVYSGVSDEPTVEKGVMLFNMGLVHGRRKDGQKWLEYTMKGIANNVALRGADYGDLARNYNSVASYYILTGSADSARLYLDRAEKVILEAYGPGYRDLSRIYTNRARIYNYEGNYQTSLEYYLQALKILEGQEVPNLLLENVICVNLGHLYSSIGEHELAHGYFLRLLGSEGIVHPARMADFYSYLAGVNIDLGRYPEAEAYLEKSLEIYKGYPGTRNIRLAESYVTMGVLMDSIKRFKVAEDYYMRALEMYILNYGKQHFRTAELYKSIGDHYSRMDSFSLALRHYQEAIHAIFPGSVDLPPERNPDPAGTTSPLFYLRVLKGKAKLLDRMAEEGREDRLRYALASLEAYKASVEIIGLLGTSYKSDDSRLYLSEHERVTYEQCVRSAYRCFEITGKNEHLTDAFLAAERAKYATLQAVLHQEEALALSGIPDSILRYESGLQRQLAVYRELLIEQQSDSVPDPALVEGYTDSIFRLRDRLETIHRSLEADYEGYFTHLYSRKVSDPGSLSHYLKKREMLIEYFIAGEEMYIFELTRRRIDCHKIRFDDSVKNHLDIVMRYLNSNSVGDTIQDSHLAYLESAYKLYRILIPETGHYNRLIIVPEGILSYLTFDVLVTESVREVPDPLNQIPFLIRDHSIRYAYSASMLAGLKEKPLQCGDPFTGFAPGYLASRDGSAGPLARREFQVDRASLEALPGTLEEVNKIGILVGGSTYTGNQATESCFRSSTGNSCIIHLATHALIDDTDPLRSTLVFSEEEDGKEDGLLKVYELYGMDLKARIVVLSACNTGIGVLRGGEGVMSLARAFSYAGVPNIIMTLWTVTDQQGYEIMLSFYRNLMKGQRVEDALRDSKLDFLDTAAPRYQHPRYWAGYILIGDPDKLFVTGHRQWLWSVMLLLILLSGLFAGKMLSKRKKGS